MNEKKKLVVFCDGTWNRPTEQPTNVSKLFEATCHEDAQGHQQIVHYLQGIGTHWYDRLIGGAFGVGISANIKDGYKFLCSNYEDGDDIYLFGFSRGAYTARSLAGLIHNMGILRRAHFDKIDEAYAHYKDKSKEWHPNPKKGGVEAKRFRDNYSWPDAKITFLGVWDTVGALGAPYGLILGYLSDKLFGSRFHDVKLSDTIESAAHAVSKDERRWPFRPTLWELQPSQNRDDFDEAWFAGVHSDVGGGYEKCGLSDKTLEWMAEKAKDRGLMSQLPKSSAVSEKHHSQTWYYRLSTLLMVKWPAFWAVDLPSALFKAWPADFYKKLRDIGLIAEDEIAAKISRIQTNGDYWRT